MRRKMLCLGLTLVLALAFASASWAQEAGIRPLDQPLGKLGPISSGNGFPLWIEDNSVPPIRVDLPTPPLGDGTTAPTMIFDPVIPGNAFSAQIGFGAEAFPYLATSRIRTTIGGNRYDADLTLGVEAAFGAEAPLDGDQFLFVRVRIRIDTPVPGNYTVITPWGQYEFTNVIAGRRAINFTYDFGGFGPVCPDEPSCFAPGVSASPGFERILVTPTPWRFLRQVNPPPPDGWIGDGVTEATISGGFNGVNSFTVIGPANAYGPGVNFITTNLFTVSGHIYQEGGAQ